jgi:hypothetical protein
MRFFALALGVSLGAVTALTVSSDAAAHDRPGAYWSVGQAKSIATIRGMPVGARECRGRGRALVEDGVRRYRHFRCVAGTREPWEKYDTVAVLYVLRPRSPYVGPRSRHTVTHVRFIGGPGIP